MLSVMGHQLFGMNMNRCCDALLNAGSGIGMKPLPQDIIAQYFQPGTQASVVDLM